MSSMSGRARRLSFYVPALDLVNEDGAPLRLDESSAVR